MMMMTMMMSDFQLSQWKKMHRRTSNIHASYETNSEINQKSRTTVQRSTQWIEYNNVHVKYRACSTSSCIKVVMRIILVLALECQDPEQDGVPNIRACVLLKLRSSANVVIVTYLYEGFALLCISFQSGGFCKLLTKLAINAEQTNRRNIIHMFIQRL